MANPYDETLKRSALMDQLGGGKAPVSTKMPVPDPNKLVGSPNLASPSPVSTTMPVGSAAPAIGGGHRDQWSGQGTATGGDFSRLAGFDQAKFNGDEQTAKYQNAHFFGRYDPAGGVQQLFADPEFTAMFPNAKPVGPDKIDYGDGFPVDVIQGYGAPGALWAWQTSNPADQGGGTPGAAITGGMPMAGDNNLQAILEEIGAISKGTQSPSKRKAVMDQLGGGGVPTEAL